MPCVLEKSWSLCILLFLSESRESSQEKTCEETDSITSITDSDGNTNDLLSNVEVQEMDQGHRHGSGASRFNRRLSYKLRKILIHGSFYVIGLCILIGGGVSSRFHPHIDHGEYSNCTGSSNASADMF